MQEGEITTLKSFLAAAMLTSLAAAPTYAAPCRDAKGKFIKCPDKAVAKPTKCKDAKGKFAKCGSAGAMPIK